MGHYRTFLCCGIVRTVFLLTVFTAYLGGVLSFDTWKRYKVMSIYSSSTALTVDGTSTRAAVFTPFGLSPGGGEKYFLSSALAFQAMGYNVDVIVGKDNVCDEIAKLQQVAAALRVPLNFNKIRLVQLWTASLWEIPNPALRPLKYEAFFTMQNWRFHDVDPIGTELNMWMCQFPFDRDGALRERQVASIRNRELQYDVVFVNSMYSEEWYYYYTKQFIEPQIDNAEPFPAVEILYPPVNGYELVPGTASRSYEATAVVKIVMIGRFFRGRQSKGHDVALNLIENITSSSSRQFHLTLIGAIHPNEDSLQYVEELKANATTKKLPVTFLTNAAPEKIRDALSSAWIFWHLTGMRKDENENDPASKEHFGIAIVEAMSAGCIPIVTDIGGPADIVWRDVHGYLSRGPEDFATNTLLISNLPEKKLRELRDASIQRSKEYSVQHFVKRFSLIAHKTMASREYKNFVLKKLPIFKQYGNKVAAVASANAAVIIETGMDPFFEFSVRNVMNGLGPTWTLQVFHSERNADYVKYALRDFHNVTYRPLAWRTLGYRDYDALLKTPEFWSSLGAEKVLLFRPDALMVSKDIEPFMKYDFIGTTSRNENFFMGHNLYALPDISGGTSFSLRSTKAMIAVCRKFGPSSHPSETEEDFFTRHLRKFGYKVASTDEARDFCPEVQLGEAATWQKRPFPLAVHAPWYYTNPDDMEIFFQKILKKVA
jgi:glycosyltransferase involved in cell wall biosynthesis